MAVGIRAVAVVTAVLFLLSFLSTLKVQQCYVLWPSRTKMAVVPAVCVLHAMSGLHAIGLSQQHFWGPQTRSSSI